MIPGPRKVSGCFLFLVKRTKQQNNKAKRGKGLGSRRNGDAMRCDAIQCDTICDMRCSAARQRNGQEQQMWSSGDEFLDDRGAWKSATGPGIESQSGPFFHDARLALADTEEARVVVFLVRRMLLADWILWSCYSVLQYKVQASARPLQPTGGRGMYMLKIGRTR